jgi:hypothetical protein
MPASNNSKGLALVLIINLVLVMLGFLVGLLYKNNPELRNMIKAIEDSALFWELLIYLVFLLAVISILRSLIFLVRFITVKIKGERFAGRIASVKIFSQRTLSPDSWIGFSFKPTALIEFNDDSGAITQFQQLVDNRTKSDQQITVLYNKNSGFKTLDDYILVAVHIWYLVLAGFILWMIFLAGVL